MDNHTKDNQENIRNLPFLEYMAHQLANSGEKDFRNVTIIFANKRAGLYFNQYLSKVCGRSLWAPNVVSFEEFVLSQVDGENTNRIQLLFTLFEEYGKVFTGNEGIDQFLFWGEMLLKDFDEMDRYLINPEILFKNLKELREIEAIDFLDDEQKKIIQQFWNIADSGKNTNEWIEFWYKLYPVYVNFNRKLDEKNQGYYGKWLRKLAENTSEIALDSNHLYCFAGFNALTTAERKIIEYFIVNGRVKVFWDYDQYYVKNENEAGRFFRNLARNKILQNTFEEAGSTNIEENVQKINIISTSSWSAQVKLVAEELRRLSSSPEWVPEKVAIILPDEKLLLPMLNSIPDNIDKYNVTMGHSILNSHAYAFFELIIRLYKNQKSRNQEKVYYHVENLLLILKNFLVDSSEKGAYKKISDFSVKHKKYWWTGEELLAFLSGKIAKSLFASTDIPYYERIYHVFERCNELELPDWDLVFINRFTEMLEGINGLLSDMKVTMGIDAYKKLVQQFSNIQKIPFSGEPLNGIQIMGVLETRNLDFDHLFVLSMNEDFMPGMSAQRSYIPHSLRLAFQMPSHQENQSVQSYLFYRMIQKCSHLNLYYNSNSDSGGGDRSRFLYQLQYDYPQKPQVYSHELALNLIKEKEFIVNAGNLHKNGLERFTVNEGYFLSPSAIHSYIVCPLRFYFKYIARFKIPEEPEDVVDARIYGLVLHKAAENLYKISENTYRKKGALTDEMVQEVIDQSMETEVGLDNQVNGKWHGKYLITYELINKTIRRLYELDSAGADFSMVSLEETYKRMVNMGDYKVCVGGNIDRIDEVGSKVRVIDYKTGSDSTSVSGFDKIEAGDGKAIFQLLFYCWLYLPETDFSKTIVPHLLKTRDIFDENYTIPIVKIAKQEVVFTESVVEDFENMLFSILDQIFNKGNFRQTEDLKNCQYCDFVEICRR